MNIPDHPNYWHAVLNRPQQRATASSNPIVRQSVNEFHALGITRIHDPSFAPVTAFGPAPQDKDVPVMPPAEVVRGICPARQPPYLADIHEQTQAIMSRRGQIQRRRAQQQERIAKGRGNGDDESQVPQERRRDTARPTKTHQTGSPSYNVQRQWRGLLNLHRILPQR